MKEIHVALLGFGTVGQGTYTLWQKNKELIQNRLGVTVTITKIFVREPKKYEMFSLSPETTFTNQIETIFDDSEISIVVEVMGGTNFAKECIEQAFIHGKHVVTANKDLLAEIGPNLLSQADKLGLDFSYEASVMGSIPIIQSLYTSFNGNKINELVGIMNGTTNYILSRMTEEGLGYEEVLKEAQSLGYAEADPTSDVEGYDAARKLAILSSLSFNRRFFFSDVTVEGISSIDKADIEYGKEFGYTIKLLGIAKETRKGISLNVYPAFIPSTHPLAAVRGAYNAIYLRGDGFEDAMFYGKGAGSLPTGSAVLSDIMNTAKNIRDHNTGKVVHYFENDKKIYSAGKIESPFYLRLVVENRIGVLAKIAERLAEQRVSVQSMLQRPDVSNDVATIVIVTSSCPQSYIQNVLGEFKALKSVKKIESVIRIMED